MKHFNVIVLFVMVLAASPLFSADKVQFKSQLDSISYTIGVNWGTLTSRDSLYLNLDMLKAGMQAAYAGGKTALTEEEQANVMKELQSQLQDRQQRKQAEAAAKNGAAGVKFLAENGKKKGVKTTASGLQYEIINPGDPSKPKPTATSKVKCHYEGTFLDGTKFDSSYDRKQPAEFGLNHVIKGWTEGLQLMNVVAKYQFYIPANLAYGEQGNQSIPPNSTLIFTVELLDVENTPAK